MSWNEHSRTAITPGAASHANILRTSMTEPEKRLWWHLRHRLSLARSHFRRQVALGPYVADFCCLAERLILEVDGGHHTHAHEVDYDSRRDAYLNESGYRVLRVTNTDVMQRVADVLETVHAALAIIPSPTHGPAERGA
jgi:very-short-patch-repair endonuclease